MLNAFLILSLLLYNEVLVVELFSNKFSWQFFSSGNFTHNPSDNVREEFNYDAGKLNGGH